MAKVSADITKKKAADEGISDRMSMLSQIEGYLQQEDDNYHMVIKRLPEVIVASMRKNHSQL